MLHQRQGLQQLIPGRRRRGQASWSAAAGGALLVLLMTAACSRGSLPADGVPTTNGASSGPATIAESAALRAALADGKVTFDEYQAGFARYTACMEGAGYSLDNVHEQNMVMVYAVPAAAVTSGVDERCYRAEFGPLDSNWQVQRQDSSGSADIMRQCLRKRGITPADTVAGMTTQMTDAGISPQDCLVAAGS